MSEIPTTNLESILRLDAVKKCTGLSRSSIYAFVKNGNFPAPLNLGVRSIGWRQSDIEAWLSTRIPRVLKKTQQ